MVVKQTIDNLRERPKHERTAVAAWISIGVVAVLFIGWLVYFFHTIETTPAPNLQGAEDSLNSSGLPQASQQLQQAYGSTTQFIIDSQGNVQVEPIGTTTDDSQTELPMPETTQSQ